MSPAFSPDRTNPPVRFSPTPGQIGVQAAIRGAKGQSGPARPSSGSRSDLHGARKPERAGGKAVTHPATPAPEKSDYRHLVAAAQYENVRRLGREIPFGIWMILNGDYRSIMDENQHPYDWFLDTP